MLKALSPLSLVMSLALTLVGTASYAAECPVDLMGAGDYLTQVADAINQAPTCYEGAEIAESCALGASGDSMTTATAVDKCDAGFLQKLTKDEAAQYASLSQKCTDKYKEMEGTMYLSMAAFCRLDVSRLYHQLYTPADSAE